MKMKETKKEGPADPLMSMPLDMSLPKLTGLNRKILYVVYHEMIIEKAHHLRGHGYQARTYTRALAKRITNPETKQLYSYHTLVKHVHWLEDSEYITRVLRHHAAGGNPKYAQLTESGLMVLRRSLHEEEDKDGMVH